MGSQSVIRANMLNENGWLCGLSMHGEQTQLCCEGHFRSPVCFPHPQASMWGKAGSPADICWNLAAATNLSCSTHKAVPTDSGPALPQGSLHWLSKENTGLVITYWGFHLNVKCRQMHTSKQESLENDEHHGSKDFPNEAGSFTMMSHLCFRHLIMKELLHHKLWNNSQKHVLLQPAVVRCCFGVSHHFPFRPQKNLDIITWYSLHPRTTWYEKTF